jgi:eukaryotic-like serine/threonine-protein kinase
MIDPTPGDIFRKGQVLNNTYEIEGPLGRGGTGEVYRACNQITGRVVAVKALNRAFSASDRYIELMKREEQMRAISHDAVVRYTDCSRTDSGHVYIVMDYVDGTPLSHWLEAGGASAEDLLVVARRVAEGLVATHAAGIVHRDLSPDNIILRAGDPAQAVIIDFGIAKDTKAGARTVVGADFAGKYEYAAPEQMHGRAEPRSDLYALGTSLLATYRGRVPEIAGSPGEILRQKDVPPDASGVPEPLKSLIGDLTQPDPARRPPSAQAVVAAIDAMLRPPPPKRRRLWPALAAAATAAVVGVAALWAVGALDWIAPGVPDAASPYRLEASWDGSRARVDGHAPDARQRSAIAAAVAAVTGAEAAEEGLAVASGAPTEGWAAAAGALLAPLAGLESFRLEMADRAARLEAVAPDAARRDEVVTAFRDAAEAAGFAATARVAAGPLRLLPEDVAAALAPFETCGPLTTPPPEGGTYPLGGAVVVRGSVADPDAVREIEAALTRMIGDRTLRLGIEALNPPICAVLAPLRNAPEGDMAVDFGYGDRDARNMTGIYRAGENPVIDLLVPESHADGRLQAVLVTGGGVLFNAIPNDRAPTNDIASLGRDEGGVRAIRLAHPLDQRESAGQLGFNISGEPARNLVLAIVSDGPLFPDVRPMVDDADAFAAALAAEIESGRAQVRAVNGRLFDTR